MKGFLFILFLGVLWGLSILTKFTPKGAFDGFGFADWAVLGIAVLVVYVAFSGVVRWLTGRK